MAAYGYVQRHDSDAAFGEADALSSGFELFGDFDVEDA